MRSSEGVNKLIFYNPLVKAYVAARLIELNKEFYRKLAAPFSATRGRPQPGVQRILESIPANADLLDLGCGNGSVAAALALRSHAGRYVGVDFSAELLAIARGQVVGLDASFVEGDLTNLAEVDLGEGEFDFIFAFAAMHHLPGEELRLTFLQKVCQLLKPDGQFIHSNWQFLNSPKLAARVQPWSTTNLDDAQVDSGDYLLDWRSEGTGLRYVHQFSEAELAQLAAACGFRVVEIFTSDGAGGNLGLYSVWSPVT